MELTANVSQDQVDFIIFTVINSSNHDSDRPKS